MDNIQPKKYISTDKLLLFYFEDNVDSFFTIDDLRIIFDDKMINRPIKGGRNYFLKGALYKLVKEEKIYRYKKKWQRRIVVFSLSEKYDREKYIPYSNIQLNL